MTRLEKSELLDYLNSLSPYALSCVYGLVCRMTDFPCFVESDSIDYLSELEDFIVSVTMGKLMP